MFLKRYFIVLFSRLKLGVINRFYFSATFFYLLLSTIKMQSYLLGGRFWAEEGVYFYRDISALPVWKGLFYLFNGHLELVTNFVVCVSTLVPIKYAPLVTTLLSFAFQSLPVWMIIRFHEGFGLSKWKVFAILLVLVGLPQSAEVWANSINLHFHFALLTGLIAAVGIHAKYPHKLFRFFLALSGLSGIPANFLGPVFFYLALKERSRERWIQFAIILGTTALQLSLLLKNGFGNGGRDLSIHLFQTWLALISQQFLSPALGFGVSGDFLIFIKRALIGDVGAVLAVILSSLCIVYLLRMFLRGASGSSLHLLGAAFLLVNLSIFSALGDKNELISSAGGGRYFFAANVLLMLAFVAEWGQRKAAVVSVFMVLVLLSSYSRIGDAIKGPDWGAEYQRTIESGSHEVQIWPAGWKMDIAHAIRSE